MSTPHMGTTHSLLGVFLHSEHNMIIPQDLVIQPQSQQPYLEQHLGDVNGAVWAVLQ